ncbi:L-type lectin-domain containing receptor kinase IX.1-like [Carex rostrata]
MAYLASGGCQSKPRPPNEAWTFEKQPFGDLGLFPEHDYTGSSQNQVVAVEFDTHKDAWDPHFYHVGIDVYNIYSVVVHKYSEEVIIANVVHAWVSYSAGEQMLNVSLNFQVIQNHLVILYILPYKLNLTQVLPTTVTVGFSAANYYKDYNELHQILSWEFNSTFGSNPIPPPQKPKSGPQVYIVALCTIAVMVVLGGTGLVLVWLKNSLIKKREDRPELPEKYSYKELVVATSNFAEKNKLGEGGFGPVFKGYLRDSCDEVAVKHLKQGSTQGSKELKSEVEILSNLRHPNLVEFFGWSEENGQLLLVYKYEIVLELTDPLCYLQIDNECNKEVVHRDIKPENVLLDSSLHAKLSNFGLVRLVHHGLNAKTTSAAGSWGYVAPELITDDGKSKPNMQSDIYSFGIVLLEIACGRRPIDLDLTRFVWEHYERKELLKVADERLKAEYI